MVVFVPFRIIVRIATLTFHGFIYVFHEDRDNDE